LKALTWNDGTNDTQWRISGRDNLLIVLDALLWKLERIVVVEPHRCSLGLELGELSLHEHDQ
jgi:hypothetical protein